MQPRRVHCLFKRLAADNPNPTTELVFNSPFELLISVILSAQATDVSVNAATANLFKAANTPQSIIEMGINCLKKHIKTIGLYNTKARNVLRTCQILVAEHNGEVPRIREQLEALPGVGRKTANVVLNTAFGEPTMAVDTHIFRVANRTGLAVGKNVLEVERGLLAAIPKKYLTNAHHWLILHGRYVCRARKPDCAVCIIADICEYEDKTSNT
jgi:endonuclease-3